MHRIGGLGILLLILGVSVAWSVTPAQRYTVVDLGAAREVLALDPQGDAALVTVEIGGETRAAIVGQGARLVDLLPGGNFTEGGSLRAGCVVGTGSTGPLGLETRGFVDCPGAPPVILPTVDGADLFTDAQARTPAGVILGYGEVRSGAEPEPMRWASATSPPLPLPKLAGAGTGTVLAANDAGDGVGSASVESGAFHAALWPATGGVVDLHTATSATSSLAFAINDASPPQVVGTIATPSGTRGFLATVAQGMTMLVPLTGDQVARTLAINDAGLMVGESVHIGIREGDETAHAVLWDLTGPPIELQTRLLPPVDPTLQLLRAVGITNTGVIGAHARIGGQDHAVLLVPQPPLRWPHPGPEPREKPGRR